MTSENLDVVQPPILRDDAERFREIFADIAHGAGERDEHRLLAFDQVNALKSAGFGTLRVPVSQGGLGLQFPAVIDLVLALAEADPNVAHVFRTHFGVVETALRTPESSQSQLIFERSVKGEMFGVGFNELDFGKAGWFDQTTSIRRVDDHYVLDGVKFYSTGNLYSDWIKVTGVNDEGGLVTVLIPIDRDGVELVDDWDGVGQRLTGSGTSRFSAVRVEESEILSVQNESENPAKYGVAPQLYLSTIIAGILANIRTDAVTLVHGRSRNFYHGVADHPRDEPEILTTIGQIETNAWTARYAVREAAQRLQSAEDYEATHGPSDAHRMEASLSAAKAKIIVDQIGPETANLLYEVGGGSSVRRALHLDRHWRNIKTLSAHNPHSYKLRVIGDHLVNNRPLPGGQFF